MLQLKGKVVQHNVNTLDKTHSNTSKKIKLNNKVGMDWVQRNVHEFPDAVVPNLSINFSQK
jgi:hypothetical protein